MNNIYSSNNLKIPKNNNNQSIEIIDIFIVVDVELIIQDIKTSELSFSQDYKKPTIRDGRYFYYMTSQQKTYNNIGNLKVTGNIGDIVRWRASSLSAQSEYQVLLYDMKKITGENNISFPVNLIKEVTDIPIPQKNSVTPSITYQKEHISYQESTLLNTGFSYYALYLAIYNRSKLIGYCSHGLSSKESLQGLNGLPLTVTISSSTD
ncbi:AidA/PixA family protein [Photorhabdus heterorhabditis]|uniref:Inclusion body protein n=1 Tax=Photorhabdus heterorhabditis TaxID=880156 RepID=A0A5B0X6T3_9GAMM|nr:AidA/PixA family protein [Photorhabdus heterorhabditis]KAA1195104.1 hypothetical protein F0L16_03505 [Photorhabdus heterorhabditis]